MVVGCFFLIGNVLFCVLHLLAFLFGFVGLIVTIPAHLIFVAVCLAVGN